MSHITNNSPKVLKTGPSWQRSKYNQRPKGLTDEEWAVQVKDNKLNKLVVLNRVPKISRKNDDKRKER